jgi:MFS transporter, FSR family, fosmidomycin resistance protein
LVVETICEKITIWLYSYDPMTTNSNPGSTNQWGGKLAFFFSYVHFSHDLTTGLLVALLPFIRQDMDLNYLQSGFLISAYSITAGICQLVGGLLCNKIGNRRAIVLGLGGVGLAAVAASLAPSYYALLAILVCMGAVAGFYHPSGVSALMNHFDETRRGKVMAIHSLGGNLGYGGAPLLGAIVASHFNWHVAYAVIAIPALIAAPLVLTQLKLSRPDKRAKDVASSKISGEKNASVWQVFKSAAGIIGISIPMQLVSGPVMSFLPLFLVDVHHLTLAAASSWVTVMRIGGLGGGLFGGWLSDKWGRRNAILLGLCIFGPTVFFITRLPFGVGLAAAFVLFGWLLAMRETTIQTFLMDISPPQLRATVFGIYFGFGQQGSSVIQPAAGDLMDIIGIVTVYNYIAFVSIGLSAAAVVSSIRNSRLNRKVLRA